MSLIPANQGAVKLSEIATDNAEGIANTPKNTDALSVLESLQQVSGDLLSRMSLFLTSQLGYPTPSSAGTVSWTGTAIQLASSTSIVTKLIQSATGVATDLVMTYGATNGETTFNSIPVASGQILYVELDRTNLTAGPLTLHNAVSGGSIINGATVKVATTLPAAINTNPTGSGPQGTIAVPIAINIAGNILWIPHGIFWPANTSSPLGAVITSTSLPIGAIIPYTTFGAASPYGYQTVKTLAPGFALCDGSVIIDPNSPLFNATRNADGTPSGSYNAALDKFTPNVNGAPPAWSNAVTWNQGDYVNNGAGAYYVAIQAVPLSIAITNTAYWIPEATYNNTSSGNAFNKYRRTTQNRVSSDNNNTFVRGNNKSFDANASGSYGGENIHVLTLGEMPNHAHSAHDNGHTHGYTASQYAEETHGGGGGARFAAGATTAPGFASIVVDPNGGGAGHNTQPAFFNAIYIVRIY